MQNKQKADILMRVNCPGKNRMFSVPLVFRFLLAFLSNPAQIASQKAIIRSRIRLQTSIILSPRMNIAMRNRNHYREQRSLNDYTQNLKS